MTFTRPRSSIGADHGGRSKLSSSPRWSGSTGLTTADFLSPSAISLLPKPNNDTTPCSTTSPWPRNLSLMASGGPGAVQLAVKITNVVGTMWCAYAFTILALISLPSAVKAGQSQVIAWIAQTFQQLVLLSIIMVGQKVASASSDRQARQTYEDAEALL